MNYIGQSDKGKRPNNEDVWIADAPIFLIADGIGGHVAGEIAAKEAVQTILLLKKDLLDIPAFLKKSIEAANEKVFSLSRTKDLKGMGTTLACLILGPTHAHFAHVGDSRIYLYRKKELKQLTADHSLKNELVAKGFLKKEDILPPPFNHTITQAIGTSSIAYPDISSLPLEKEDLFFLCTDGLSDYVSFFQMLQILDTIPSLEEKVTRLILTAKENHSPDNITVLMIQP